MNKNTPKKAIVASKPLLSSFIILLSILLDIHPLPAYAQTLFNRPAITQQQVAANLQAQEHQKAILASLQAKAIYDAKTEVSYVFEDFPTDKDVIAVAAKHNIFFAKPYSLLVNVS